MSKNPVKLKIAWLYPDVLQGYSDEVNVEAFYKRAKWRDIDIELIKVKTDDLISASKYDFYYIGGTNTQNLSIAQKYLSYNAQELKVAASANVPIFAVHCGYLLLSTSYQLNDEIQARGLDILSASAIEDDDRHCGYIAGSCAFLDDKIIAGFENHNLVSYLSFETRPFLTLIKGDGNNAKDNTEGAVFNNTIGTYIQSPILAQNPHLCDYLINEALKVKYKCEVPLSPLIDDIEWYCYNYLVEAK